jgi:hypothetical protein
MALYSNQSHQNAIVTIRVISVLDPQKALSVGIKSAMKAFPAQIGVHDLVVGPGQVLEALEGVDAAFLQVRGVL